MTYTPRPVDTASVDLSPIPPAVLEALARNTHEVWARGRMDEGWAYGEAYDGAAKKHPSLIPYDELPEREKEYDRHTSLEAVRLLLALGFSITPPAAP